MKRNQLQIVIASTKQEREAAFRLVYRSYLRSGLVGHHPFQMRLLPHHLLPTTDVFVASSDRVVVGTVTLIGDSSGPLPMETIYHEEIDRLRSENRVVGEVSSLAGSLGNCLELFRWMVQTARRRGLNGLAVAVHPKHVRFYQRYLAFERIGEPASYPTVCNNPAVALYLDFEQIDIRRPKNYDKFFGIPVPTNELQPHPMTSDEIDYFRNVLHEDTHSRASESILGLPPLLTLGEQPLTS